MSFRVCDRNYYLAKVIIMKRLAFFTAFVLAYAPAFSQPWKLTEQFRLAFLDTYDDYICHKTVKGDKIYIEGFEKSDSLKKVFAYEASQSLRKDGYFRQYDKQGRMIVSMLFEDGIARKLSINFTDSTSGKYNLDNNLLNGQYTLYYSNGKIKESGQYKDNAPIGAWIFYNDAGKIMREGHYCGGFRRLLFNVNTKKLIILNQLLDTVSSETFTNAMLDSLKTPLHYSHGLIFPIDLVCKMGTWRYYDENGIFLKEKNYLGKEWEQPERL